MTTNWQDIIKERHENGMFKIKPLMPVLNTTKQSIEQPVVETIPEAKEEILKTTATEITPEVSKAVPEAAEVIPEAMNTGRCSTATLEVNLESKLDDEKFEEKSNSENDDVDMSKLASAVGSHKTNSLIIKYVENKNKNKDDTRPLECGKESNISFVVGKVQYPVPMFWDSDGHKMHFEDSARGLSVVLTCNDLKYNCHQITVNNNLYSPIKILTNLLNIDVKVLKSSMLKFMPLMYIRQQNQDGAYNFHNPFACYYMRNHKYQRNDFWYEDCFYSDESIAHGDLITSLRILFVMGYKKVFLDGFKTTSSDFAIFDDVIKNAVGKIEIYNIGNSEIRNVPKFDKVKAISSCILY